MIPTKEQIQWVWEQCGWEYKYFEAIFGGTTERTGWYLNGVFKRRDRPPIDLNNLFKYAVPRLDALEWHTWNCEPFVTHITVYGQGKIEQGWNKDPALALFWAIYKALGGKE